MRVLITGASGKLGAYVIRALADKYELALMEAASDLPVHDVYFLNADDTTALEPTRELVERFNPPLAPLAAGLEGHQSLLSCDKLKRAVGWRHRTSWRKQ